MKVVRRRDSPSPYSENSDNDCEDERGARCRKVDGVCLCEKGPYCKQHPQTEECVQSDPQGESDADADIEDTDSSGSCSEHFGPLDSGSAQRCEAWAVARDVLGLQDPEEPLVVGVELVNSLVSGRFTANSWTYCNGGVRINRAVEVLLQKYCRALEPVTGCNLSNHLEYHSSNVFWWSRLQVVGSLQRISSRKRKRQRITRQDTTESEDDGGRSHRTHRWSLRLSPHRTHNRTILEDHRRAGMMWAVDHSQHCSETCGAASYGWHRMVAVPWAASCGQRPMGQRPMGGVLWVLSYGWRPVGSILWVLSSGCCPVGAVLWGSVLWVLSYGWHPVGSVLWVLSYGCCPMGGALWAAYCGCCPLGAVLWVLSCGQCPLGAVLWVLSCGCCPCQWTQTLMVVLWGSCPLKNRVIQYTEKQMDYSLDLYTYRASCTESVSQVRPLVICRCNALETPAAPDNKPQRGRWLRKAWPFSLSCLVLLFLLPVSMSIIIVFFSFLLPLTNT
ncbi:hypothetical protein NFI96_020502 [Prochilodus magdalenae]|nr:hypothetical protein NFI96_020502 [Prochilodus magdalenae]